MADIKKTINHSYQVIDGINKLIKMEVLRIDGTTVYLFPELYHSDPQKLQAWMKNIYLYCRLKLNYKEGTELQFRNIETTNILGAFDPS